jgi:hypothetical protein
MNDQAAFWRRRLKLWLRSGKPGKGFHVFSEGFSPQRYGGS